MAKFKLKDLTLSKLEYGSGAAACAFDGHVRYVRITDITDDGSLASDIVSPSYYEEKHVLQEGDILFARTGATVGKTFLYRNKYGKCVYAGFLIRMVPDRSIVLPDYIYYFTKSPRYRDFVAANMKVVAQPNINAKQYGDLEIDVPSFKEQQSVVDKLVKIDELIALRKEQLAKLEQLVKSRFIELFGTVYDNKFGYEIKTLQDVCEKIKDGTHQTPTYTEDVVNGYKFLSSKDVTTGKIDWTHLKYIPEELHNELYARIAPKKGDILLAKNGTTGIAAIVDRDEIFDIYVSLALLRPIQISSVYLWAAINSVETKQQFDSSLKGIGVPNLHLGEIKKARIIVPPMEEQNQFAAFVEQTDKSKLAIQQSLDKLELLKKSLMQEYFG